MKSFYDGKNLLKNGIWSFFIKVFGTLSNILIAMVLARVMTVDEFGIYLIAISVAMFLGIVCRFGMKQPVVKQVSLAMTDGRPDRIGHISLVVLSIVTTGTMTVGVLFLSSAGTFIAKDIFSSSTLAEAVTIWMVLIAAISLQVPLAEIFRGMNKIKLAGLHEGPLSNFLVLSICSACLLAGTSLDLFQVILITAIAVSINLVLGSTRIAMCVKDYGYSSYHCFKELVSHGSHVYISNIVLYLIANAGLWICGALLNAEDAALYGAALRMTLLVQMPLFVINMIIQPAIVSLHRQDRLDILQEKVTATTTIAFMASVVIVAIFVSTPGFWLETIFSQEYREASITLVVLSLGQLANVYFGPAGNILMLTGHQKIATNIILAFGFINLILSIIAAKQYGIVGIAVINSASLAAQHFVNILMIKKHLGFWVTPTWDVGKVISTIK